MMVQALNQQACLYITMIEFCWLFNCNSWLYEPFKMIQSVDNMYLLIPMMIQLSLNENNVELMML